MTVVTPERVFGLLTKGSLLTPEGTFEMAEDDGHLAAYSVNHGDVRRA
jgi:hypothetical protein